MPRATPKWIGETDDSKPPPQVRLRVFREFFAEHHKAKTAADLAKRNFAEAAEGQR